MTGEIVNPADISVDLLKALFDAAFLQTKIDSDGDLHVKDQVGCYVFPTKNNNRIRLASLWGTKATATRLQELTFCNRVNDELSVVRAYIRDNHRLGFDYYIPIEGGISKRAIVLATKFFLSVVPHAIEQCDSEDIVE